MVRESISLEELYVGGNISCSKKAELLQLLNKSGYCFAMNMEELGCAPLLETDIPKVAGTSPVALRPYKMKMKGKETARKIVREWRKRGIASETHSPYASRFSRCLRKGNGD